jgi:fibronectin-binding autotransporter adhesin
MKTNRRNPFSRLASHFTAGILISFSALPAFSATRDWSATAADTVWATGSNWVGGNAPADSLTTDDARFNQTSYTSQPNYGTRSINRLIFGDGTVVTAPVTLSGTALSLGGDITVNANSGTVDINGSSQIGWGTFQATNNSASLLTIGAGLRSRGAAGTTTFSFNGSGQISVPGSISNGGGTNEVRVFKSGAGSLSLSGINTFTGGIQLSGSTANSQLNINSTTALGSATSRLTIDSGDNARINNTSGGAITIANNNPQTWTNNFTFVGTNELNMGTGAITLGGSRTVTVSASTLTLGGIIDDGTSSFSLTKAGTGTMTLTARNTYNGNTTITNGRLNLNHTATSNPAILGNVTLSTSSARPILYLLANNQLESTATISSTLSGSNSIFTDIILGGRSQTIAGFVASGAPGSNGRTIVSNRPTGDSGGGNGVLTINNSSTVTLGGGRLEIRDGGSGTLEIVKDGPGILVFNLSAASGVTNTYTGGFTLKAGTTQIAGPAFGATTPIRLQGGTISSSNTTARTFVSGNTVSLEADMTLGDATNNGKLTFPGAATLSDNRTLAINSTIEFSGGLGEATAGRTLTKTGPGQLILAGTSTYTGATNVNTGRFDIAGTLASPVTVAAGATIGGEGTSNNSLTFGAGTSTLAFDPATTEALTTASVSTSGATVVVSPVGTVTTGATYTVLTNTAGFSGSPAPTYIPSSRGTLAFGGPLSGGFPTQLQFTAAAPVATLTWTGNSASPTLWDINTTANWSNGVTADKFFDFDSITFDDSATTTTVAIQPASVNVASFTVNNPTKPYTFSGGSITGTGDLLKSGNASLTLSNANSFTGGTTLNAGTLNINNPTALGAATGPFIIAGGTIDNTSGSAITTASYPITLDANLNFSGTNDLNLGAGATNLGSTTATSRTITTTAGTLRLGGVISDGLGGANEIIKSGAGTLTLAGASTYTGQTTISAGTLRLGASSGALTGPLGDTGPGTVVQNGATLDFAGFGVGVESLSIAGTGVGGNGALVNSGGEQTSALRFLTLTANASIGASGNRYDIRGASAASPGSLDMGGFNLTKTGGGYFTIVNTTVTPGVGNIDIVGGTLGLHATNILDGGASNTITIRNGAALDCFESGTWNVPIWSVLMDAGSSFTSSGGTTGWDSTVTLNGTANLGGSANLTLNGVVSGASGALTKIGAGNLNLNGTAANTYGGPTTVNAGTLNLGKTVGVNAVPGNITINSGGVSLLAADQIPNASSVTLTTATSKFNINGRSETIANLDMQNANSATSEGLVTGATGKLTITGTLTHTLGNITLNSSGAGNSSEINANTVINNGGSWIFGTTDGTQSLNIGAGGLIIGNGSTIAVGASVASPNFISLGGNVTSTAAATTNTISGAGSLNLNATRTFNVADGAAASDLTIASVIADGTGTGSMIKTGLGTQTLASANSYTGATTINGGTLALGVAGSIANTSAINIAAGARFETVLQPTYAMPTGRTFTFSLDAADAGSSGQINAAGLDITNGTVAFNITGPLNDPSYVLATYTSRTGAAFASVTPPSGYTLDYAFNGGTQIALVQSATSPYVTWGTPFGLAAGSEGGDLDNDGLSNFEEFAFGLTPNSGSSVNPITAQLNKTNGQFTYQRLAGSGLTYSVWTSENLITWTEDTAAIQTPTLAGANESVAVTLSATPKPLTASRLFIRVRAN